VARIVWIVVNSRRPTRAAPWASPGALLLMFVIAGLLLMHGVQASTSPTDIRGLPMVSASVMHGTGDHEEHLGGHPCGNCSGHQHPGGQMCLALLVIGALFLFTVMLIGRLLGRPMSRRSGEGAYRHRGRAPPPPSIFQLAALRL
jgi:Family of unknown function (DUF6153)